MGHNPPRWVVDATQEYQKRFGRHWPFSLIELKPEKRLAGRPIDGLLAQEAARIQAHVPKDAALVVLDERGEMFDSRALAQRLVQTAREAPMACFVIGSADGVDPALRQRAAWQWSLSKLTFAHSLVRVCVVEQLYRAVSLLEGLPYHRD